MQCWLAFSDAVQETPSFPLAPPSLFYMVIYGIF